MKRLIALGLCWSAVACDAARQVGIALEPRAAVLTDSVRRAAFAVAARVSERHGLARAAPRPGRAWQECFVRGNFIMCGRPTERGVLFHLIDRLTPSWTPPADSVRRGLLAGLKELFGEGAVRECEWREHQDPRRAGCAP
jgi:hypothetical protein